MSRPVVLVHGFGTSSELTWRANGWIDLLADLGREVIPVDLLGHGTAPKPTSEDAYDDLTARVFAAIDDAGGGPVDGVGFSLGAKTLLQAACARPEVFSSLVVAGVGANLFRPRDDHHAAVVDAVESGDAGGNPALRYFADLALLPGNDRAALAACMRNGGGSVDADGLSDLDLPVLVVLGDQDFAGPATPLVDALPNAESVTLPKTDHARTPKSFDFIDAALDFLSR